MITLKSTTEIKKFIHQMWKELMKGYINVEKIEV